VFLGRALLVCGLLPSLLAGCAGLGDSTLPPQVTLINLRPLKASGFEQRFEIDLRVINPNDFDLAFDGFTFDLDVNDSKIATGVSNQALTVPRLGEAETTVIASTSLLELFKQFLSVAQKGTLDYRIYGLAYLAHPTTRRLAYESSGKFEILPDQGPGGSLVPISTNLH
jgi:LEA14-like dessication related protein